jgi:alkylhydroperoxidase family enzyme
VDCDEADIEKLEELGFSLDAVYDITTTASIYNYNNRVAEAAGHLPDRKNHGLFR